MSETHIKAFRLACLMLCAVAFASTVIPAQARSLAEIKASGAIRLCTYALKVVPRQAFAGELCDICATPPGCREDCSYKGYWHEVAVAFADTLAPAIVPKYLRLHSWQEQFMDEQGEVDRKASYTPALLASGTCDIFVTGMSQQPWRANKLDFVTVYPSRPMVVIQKSKQDQIKSPADLGGHVAGTTQDAALVWLEEQNRTVHAANPIRIEVFATSQEKTQAFQDGKVDFEITPGDVAMWRTRHVYQDAVVAFVLGKDMLLHSWGFNKADQDLRALVEAFFEAQRTDQNSAVNRIWKEGLGMSLTRYIELMALIK